MSDDRMTPADDVIVSLSFPYLEDEYPERRIVLNSRKPSVQIGRTSKRVADLSAALDNGWIESPVISREHAEIFLGHDQEKAVYIADRHSRHGTFLNKDRVSPNAPVRLQSGDNVRFGIDIQRDQGLFPPPCASIDIEFITRADRNTSGTHTPVDRSVGYHVPDPSDDSEGFDSDESDDGDRTAVRSAVAILRAAGVQRAPKLAAESETLSSPTAKADVSSSGINSGSEVIDLDNYKLPGENIIDLTGLPSLQMSPMNSAVTSIAAPEILTVDDDDDEDEGDESVFRGTGATYLGDDIANPVGLDTSESEHELSDDEPQTEAGPSVAWNSSLLASTEYSSDEDDDDFEAESNNSTDSDEDSLSDIDEVESRQERPKAANGLASAQAPPSSYPAAYEEAPQPAHEHCETKYLPAIEKENIHGPPSPQGRQWMLPPLQQILGSEELTHPSSLAPLGTPLNVSAFISGSAANMASQPATSQNLPPWREPPVRSQMDLQGKSFNMWRAENEEYLEARESNKEILRRRVSTPDRDAQKSSATLLSAPTVEPALVTDPKPGHNMPSVSQLPTPDELDQETFDLVPRSDDVKSHPSAPAQTAWTDSGARFLTNPPEEFPISDVRHSPELDMTSAWSYQQSKMAAAAIETSCNTPPAVNATDTENVNTTLAGPESLSSANSSKRKASDMSDISPEEKMVEASAVINAVDDSEAVALATLEDLTRERQVITHASNASATSELPKRCRLGDHIHDCDRSPKRLRRMAEAAGLVALGGAAAGVAFITTLIATAPAL